MSVYDVIYDVVRCIPYGQVATYGQVADLAGLPRRARMVGYALFRVTDEMEVPWHRVVNAKGQVSESPFRNGSDYLQRSLLEAEGVQFNKTGTINLKVYGWHDPLTQPTPLHPPNSDGEG